MSDIEIVLETEGQNQWSYQVRVFEQGRAYNFDVTLNWSDYDLWCRGRVAPQKVVRTAFKFLLQNEPVTTIISRFDCSLIRRYFPSVDQQLPKML